MLRNTIYWRSFLYSTVCFWLLCQNTSAHRCMDLFLSIWFNSIDQPVCLCIPLCSVYHYCLIVQLEVRDGESSSSFVVQNYLGYSGFFVCLFVCLFFHWKLRISLSRSAKYCVGILMGITFIEPVDCFWQDVHFHYVNPTYSWE